MKSLLTLLASCLIGCTTSTVTHPDGTVEKTTSMDPTSGHILAAGAARAFVEITNDSGK